jgi:ppGpp synthetase/RelA/SpoT-type nucleotidyltranferase
VEIELKKKLLEQYDDEVDRYEALALRVNNLLTEILAEHEREVHSVAHRVKTRESLEKKISKEGKSYNSLSNVTDICGVRIVTYFPDDVDPIAEIVEREFRIDRDNSIDKRKLLDPDRFGYLSLHLIATLPTNRVELTEYKKFADLKIEIQIRSILQHAWAEIEHDLGYKTKLGIPREVRRRFSRLAGLLEIADQEFSAIRKDLHSYRYKVARKIEQSPQSVAIDKVSLTAFIMSSQTLIDLDERIASLAGARVRGVNSGLSELYVNCLHQLDVKNIATLESILSEDAQAIEDFAGMWLSGKSLQVARRGISLLYLVYVLLARNSDVPQISHALEGFYPGDRDHRSDLAVKIKEVYENSKKTDPINTNPKQPIS